MIPFIDLKAQYRRIEQDVRRGIDAVLEHGQYIMGPEVAELERRLAAFTGSRHALSCSSGTDALLMPLMAMGVGPGDAVLTTPFTFVATAEVIALLGATPVFVDIDPVTFNIDPAQLDAAITALKEGRGDFPLPVQAREREGGLTPKAIITVDLFGLPCDYDAVAAVAAKHGLPIIEDAAQGFGGEYKGRKACSLTWVGCTSFFPAKPLGGYGDGGAIFTDDDKLIADLVSIRIHGQGSDKYDNIRLGINGRLDSLQAAVLLPKLAIFPEEIALRQKVAAMYAERLAPLAPRLKTPSVPEGYLSAWAQYSVLCEGPEQRTALQAALREQGVPTAVYYPIPLHLQTAYTYLGYRKGDMPKTEDCARRIFSLPMHPYLDETAIDTICGALKQELK